MTPDLRAHLVASRLAGHVATSPAHAIGNCRKLLAGDPEYTFGLSFWHELTLDEAVGAIAELCGEDAVSSEHDGPGWIDPDLCVEAIDVHRDRLGSFARDRGSVLLATGHPTGLLPHYAAIGRSLVASGCRLLTTLDDERVPLGGDSTHLRFVDAVACIRSGGDLLHTHRADPMEALLDALEADGTTPDLVVGDHGMAGAAVERGIPTLSIADVNDPALPVAQVRGITDGVLVIDDNLRPALFEPVTARILEKV